MRYDGTIEPLCEIDASDLISWIKDIPLEQWPQQDRMNADCPYPAMITNRAWPGWAEHAGPVVAELMGSFPDCHDKDWRISIEMPGQRIIRHTDMQVPEWVVRVHVPISTNHKALMFIEDEPFHMSVGTAYLVNTEREHHLYNLGDEPRIHFFFDVIDGALRRALPTT